MRKSAVNADWKWIENHLRAFVHFFSKQVITHHWWWKQANRQTINGQPVKKSLEVGFDILKLAEKKKGEGFILLYRTIPILLVFSYFYQTCSSFLLLVFSASEFFKNVNKEKEGQKLKVGCMDFFNRTHLTAFRTPFPSIPYNILDILLVILLSYWLGVPFLVRSVHFLNNMHIQFQHITFPTFATMRHSIFTRGEQKMITLCFLNN